MTEDRIAKAITDQCRHLYEWLKENHPEVFDEQKHLDEGTAERAYWHMGRFQALKDVFASGLLRQPSPVTIDIEANKSALMWAASALKEAYATMGGNKAVFDKMGLHVEQITVCQTDIMEALEIVNATIDGDLTSDPFGFKGQESEAPRQPSPTMMPDADTRTSGNDCIRTRSAQGQSDLKTSVVTAGETAHLLLPADEVLEAMTKAFFAEQSDWSNYDGKYVENRKMRSALSCDAFRKWIGGVGQK